MKKAPAEHSASSTEAVFALVRSELANVSLREGEDLKILDKKIQDKHLAHCSEEVPLHYMTIWTTRSFLARCRLMEHYSTHPASLSGRPTDTQRSTAYGYAIRIVECDTQLRTSPLIKGYLWLVESWYSPVLAYVHILNRLAKQPKDEHAEKAWKSMCDNYDALADGPKHHRTRLMFALKFSRITLQAWEAREALLNQENKPPELPPCLVLDSRMNVMRMSSNGPPGQRDNPGEQPTGIPPSLTPSGSSNTAMTFMTPASSDIDACQVFGGDHDFADSTAGFYPDMLGQASMDIGMDQFWTENVFN